MHALADDLLALRQHELGFAESLERRLELRLDVVGG